MESLLTEDHSLPGGENVFKRLLDQVATPVSVFTTDLNFVYVNESAQQLVQKPWTETIGRNLFDVFPEEPEREQIVREKFLGCLSGQTTRMDAVAYEVELDGKRQLRYWQAVQKPFYDAEGNVTHILQCMDDITDEIEMHREKEAISQELDHRVKNMISVISATATIAGQSASSVPQFVEDFNARLRSMDRTYSRLNDNHWRGIELRALFEEEIQQFMRKRPDAYKLDGPYVQMSVKATKDAAMMIHEAATNAAKYGCFSTPDGKLDVSWRLEGKTLIMEWVESGLTDVVAPTHIGFGTQLFDMMADIEMERDYKPTGVHIKATVNGQMIDGVYHFG